MLPNISSKSKMRGFTLIELMIVMMVTVLTFSIGYANYRSFAYRKDLERAATQVRSELKIAKELALSGNKPSHVRCDSPERLYGYEFRTIGQYQYRIFAECTGGDVQIGGTEELEVAKVRMNLLSRDVNCTGSTSNQNSIMFEILGRGIDQPDDTCIEVVLTHEVTGDTYTITIQSSGSID